MVRRSLILVSLLWNQCSHGCLCKAVHSLPNACVPYTCASILADLHGMCALLEDDLVTFESLCEDLHLEKSKQLEEYKLQEYQKSKVTQLQKYSSKSLWYQLMSFIITPSIRYSDSLRLLYSFSSCRNAHRWTFQEGEDVRIQADGITEAEAAILSKCIRRRYKAL